MARGYDRSKVDAFLARCAASLGEERLAELPELARLRRDSVRAGVSARQVRDVRFPVRLRGYDLAEVDALLRRVAAALPQEPAPADWDPEPVPPTLGPGPGLRRALRGYVRDDVDAFLVRCAHSLGERVHEVPELAALTGRPRTGVRLRASDVEHVRFRMVWRGYAVDAVDALLDRIQAVLRD